MSFDLYRLCVNFLTIHDANYFHNGKHLNYLPMLIQVWDQFNRAPSMDDGFKTLIEKTEEFTIFI